MAIDVDLERDWCFLTSFLREDWREKAFELRALWRRRKIPNADALLKMLLMHAGEGLSLRDTAVRCAERGIASVSDVAILHRLRVCASWVELLCADLAADSRCASPDDRARRLVAVDATAVRERGPTGSCWRLHYCMDLRTSRCLDCEVTDEHGGESLRRFDFQPNDLVFADRGYSRPKEIAHVQTAGAQIVLRYRHGSMVIVDSAGAPMDLLANLRRLVGDTVLDQPVQLKVGGQLIPGRLCAVRKSPEAAARARRQVRDNRRRKQSKHVKEETLELSAYFLIFTTEPAAGASARQILTWYGWRWQIEIRFKRLKQLFSFGHLPKHDPVCVKAWFQLKLLLILMVDALTRHAGRFSPYGYPLRQPRPASQSVA